MPDYNQILEQCKRLNATSAEVLDNFLIYYSATKDKTDQDFETKITRFKDVVKEMPSPWKGMIKSQYIAHRIFRQGGLIHKYLNHVAVKDRSNHEQEWLSNMAAHPWRFCFSQLMANPAPDFYEMEDILTGESFLLYSPTVTRNLEANPVMLWFNLIGYNGSCWQTYGPVTGFCSFNVDDIFFYATEINPAIESEPDLIKDINDNPVRYMMLASGATLPLVIQENHEVVQVTGEGITNKFNVQALKKEFRVEFADSIFKLSHAKWSEPPHFAEAYYDEESRDTLLYALTDKGYHEMAVLLNARGLDIPEEPDVRLHLTMSHVIKKVLKRMPELNPYAHLFEQQKSPETEAEFAKLNQLLALALPDINAGRQPDVAALAKQVGVDQQIAEEVLKKSMDRINYLRSK